MNSIEALDVATKLIIHRLGVRERHYAALAAYDLPAREADERHIARYSAALETLEALRELIADRNAE